MKNKPKLNKDELIQKAQQIFESLQKYSTTIFICLIAVVYGFIFFQISSLNNRQPNQDQIDKFVRSSHSPRVDKKVIKQLESLKDNSVNVQALFDQSRENPFQ